PESSEEQKQILSRQLAQPVRFAAMLRKMQADGVRTFIEVGPQKKLNGLLKATALEGICLSLDGDATSSLAGLGQLLAQLASLGYPVQLTAWDAGPEIPQPTEQKNFTVMITGANYRNPKKAAPAAKPAVLVTPKVAVDYAGSPSHGVGGVVAHHPTLREKGESSRAPTPAIESMTSAPRESILSAAPQRKPEVLGDRVQRPAQSRPQISIDRATPPVAQASTTNDSKVSFPQEGTMSSSNDSWQRLEKIMQDMHDIQRKTADAHTLFLENQRQFQTLLHGLMRGETLPAAPETSAAPQAPAPVARPAPHPQTDAQAPTARSAQSVSQVSAARPTQAAAHALVGRPVQTRAQEPVARPVQSAQSPSVSPAQTAAPVMAPSAAISVASRAVSETLPLAAEETAILNTSNETSVYDVLSACTGYPAELLKPEMNLESDLGIDSIKKVEIFSQLQSHYPHMEGDASRLGELQTIGDLLQLSRGSETPVDPSERVGAWAAGTVALAASSSAQDQQTILEIVAEKTGFPVTMLQPGMELEADLGIDSIKKVEIFSVIQERLPQLAGLSTEELNGLRSISDLFELLGGSNPPPADDDVSPLTRIMSSGAEELVYQVLADKTGYPQEVLAASMQLEADLGIDSIKRVEIFSALAELIPGLQSATQDKVGALATVADLLHLAREGLGDAEQLAEQSLLEPDHRHADWDLSKKKNPPEPIPADAEEPVRAGAIAAAKVITLADALDAEDYVDDTQADLGDPLEALHLQRLDAEVFHPQGQARSWQTGSEVWIGDDGSNLARNIMLKLQERGLLARLVSLAQADRLQIPEQLHGLILLAPLKLEVPPVRWLGHAFRLLRRCGPALKAQPDQSLVAVVTRNGGRFGLDGLQTTSQVYGGALSALSKTVAEEWSGIHARALDLGRDFTDGIEAALRCLDGILLAGPVELGISRDQVYQLVLHDHSLEIHDDSSESLPKDALILVTGGARGVTAASLIPIARTWQPRFVIWGRTALGEDESDDLRGLKEPAALKRALMNQNPELTNPRELEGAYRQLIQQRELRDNIRQLEAAGATVIYQVVDVSKDAELRQSFHDLWQTHGVPTAVI
ncbi:MAG: phosphopantetheine-binding protein, partial [Pseudobdellovibrionaceae bacterium]|nr:phosphopantetheine-binding protein [Pseudobdellovibrionaceae bacterium]